MMADTLPGFPPALPLLPSWRVWTEETLPDSPEAATPFPLFAEIRSEFLAAAVVDRESGAVLTPGGPEAEAMKSGALANAPVVDAAIEAGEWQSIEDEVLEIRVTTKSQVHFVRPLDPEGSMYLYVALDKEKGKYFDMAQMRIKMIELAFGL